MKKVIHLLNMCELFMGIQATVL